MKVRAHIWGLLAAFVVSTVACRDERAGPKRQQAAIPAAAGIQTVGQLPADLTYRQSATWANGTIEYLGSRLNPPNPKPGQTVELQHFFRANKAPPQGYQFFMHLVDASNGQMVGNLDHPFQNGAAPLERWEVGKIIFDAHQITLPSNLPASSAQLRVLMGFWNADGRLPLDDARMHEGNQRALGPIIEMRSDAPPHNLPEYKIGRTKAAPKIDGELSDAVWKTASAVQLMGSLNGAPAKFKTMAQLAYDDQFIYVAFDCEDPDVWGTFEKHDDPIYTQEAVEVFFDADADGKTYNELQVSPNNVTFDASFAARRLDLEKAVLWDSGMKTAVKVRGTVNQPDDQDSGWSVEMQIPIRSLNSVLHVPPKPGDRWKFNLYRLEIYNNRRAGDGQAFAPTVQPDFHNLSQFASLIFE